MPKDFDSVESSDSEKRYEASNPVSWTEEVMELLESLRLNSINLSEYHRKRFYHFKSYSKYFDLPILVLSSISASFSVGMQEYLSQSMISAITCFVGLAVSIITSIKLYLNISDSMQIELKMSKEFYNLAIDVYRTTHLPAEQRGVDGVDYLNRQYSTYAKLVESSNLLRVKFKKDQLTPIRKKFTFDDTPGSEDTPQTPRGSPLPPLYTIHETPSSREVKLNDASV